MLEQIQKLDNSILLLINGWNSPFWDKVMLIFTARMPWLPLYALILGYIIYRFAIKEGKVWFAISVVFAIVATFAITDIGSSFIKDLTQRLRPGHNPDIAHLVRLLDGKGGMYGFVSSHAANVFGLATITSLIFAKKSYSLAIFIWATLVSYSRIYVGRHFLTDVICGAVLGMLTAYLAYLILGFLFKKNKKKRRK
jgi:undecaprenyl-diphosphatase